MIFDNPAGAPELACDECGCRGFDPMTNRCEECGAEVSEDSLAEFVAALARFGMARAGGRAAPRSPAGDAAPFPAGKVDTPPRR